MALIWSIDAIPELISLSPAERRRAWKLASRKALRDGRTWIALLRCGGHRHVGWSPGRPATKISDRGWIADRAHQLCGGDDAYYPPLRPSCRSGDVALTGRPGPKLWARPSDHRGRQIRRQSQTHWPRRHPTRFQTACTATR